MCVRRRVRLGLHSQNRGLVGRLSYRRESHLNAKIPPGGSLELEEQVNFMFEGTVTTVPCHTFKPVGRLRDKHNYIMNS